MTIYRATSAVVLTVAAFGSGPAQADSGTPASRTDMAHPVPVSAPPPSAAGRHRRDSLGAGTSPPGPLLLIAAIATMGYLAARRRDGA